MPGYQQARDTLLVLWLWANWFSFLDLPFPICKVWGVGEEERDGNELQLPLLTLNGPLSTESSSTRSRTGSSHQFHGIVCGPSPKTASEAVIKLVRTNFGDS